MHTLILITLPRKKIEINLLIVTNCKIKLILKTFVEIRTIVDIRILTSLACDPKIFMAKKQLNLLGVVLIKFIGFEHKLN